MGFKAWGFKGQCSWLWDSSKGIRTWRKGNQAAWEHTAGKNSLKSTEDTQWGEGCRKAVFTERPLWEQRNWQVPLPSPTLQHKHGVTCGNQPRASTHYLICLHQVPPPCAPVEPPFPGMLASVPKQPASSPRKPTQTPVPTTCPNLGVWGALIPGVVIRGLISQADHKHLVKTHHSHTRDQKLTATGKEGLCRWLAWRAKQSGHNSSVHIAHTGDTPWSVWPWDTRVTTLQVTIEVLLYKAITLKNRRSSWLFEQRSMHRILDKMRKQKNLS